jgi:hypothetical protein
MKPPKYEIETLKQDLLKNLLTLKRQGYGRFFIMQQEHQEKIWGFIKRGKTSIINIIGQKLRGRGSSKLEIKFETYEGVIKDEFVKVADDIIKFVNR